MISTNTVHALAELSCTSFSRTSLIPVKIADSEKNKLEQDEEQLCHFLFYFNKHTNVRFRELTVQFSEQAVSESVNMINWGWEKKPDISNDPFHLYYEL